MGSSLCLLLGVLQVYPVLGIFGWACWLCGNFWKQDLEPMMFLDTLFWTKKLLKNACFNCFLKSKNLWEGFSSNQNFYKMVFPKRLSFFLARRGFEWKWFSKIAIFLYKPPHPKRVRVIWVLRVVFTLRLLSQNMFPSCQLLYAMLLVSRPRVNNYYHTKSETNIQKWSSQVYPTKYMGGL